MAKKAKKEEMANEPIPQKETVVENVVETPVMEKPIAMPEPPKTPEWEIKERVYYLIGEKTPLSYHLRSCNIYYFDEEKGYERELKHTSNQRTCFVDEFPKGSDARLEHIIFRNGQLVVPREKQTLQKLLSLYHPHNGKVFKEFKPVAKAESEIDWLEFEIAALNAAQAMDIDAAEAVMRVELGSKVSEMSSKELRRDLLLLAKKNPKLFLELAVDENIQLRNVGIKATEMGIIKISQDQRTFSWGSNDRKLMTVPFDEHPYSALAAWFKTDEGMEVYSSIEKRLNA